MIASYSKKANTILTNYTITGIMGVTRNFFVPPFISWGYPLGGD